MVGFFLVFAFLVYSIASMSYSGAEASERVALLFGRLLWLVATVLAVCFGLGGFVAGTVPVPRILLAFWFGMVACCLEIPASALVVVAFWNVEARLGASAEGMRPGLIFWSITILTIVLAVFALGLGLARRSVSQENEPM